MSDQTSSSLVIQSSSSQPIDGSDNKDTHDLIAIGTSTIPHDTINKEPIIEDKKIDTGAAKPFVDPFLTPGKSSGDGKVTVEAKSSNAIITTDSAKITPQTSNFSIDDLGSDDSNSIQENNNQDQISPSTDLDSMIANLDTTTADTPATTIINNGLDSKRKKILLIGTGVLGLIVLGLVSYLVFTTMFPVETNTISDTVNNLQANVAGSIEKKDNEGSTGSLNPTAIEDQKDINNDTSTGGDSTVYTPGQETTTTPDTTPSENTTAQGFGSEDELPLGSEPVPSNASTSTTPSTDSPSLPTTDATINTDELPTVTQSPEKISQELTNKVDQAKQLLALIKTKGNNVDQMKTLALLIKEIKAIQLVIKEGTYSSFSDSVEKPLSDLSFRFDKLTSEVVGQ